MAVSVKTKRFTVDEYERMGETGILHDDDRVELVEGAIVEMAPIGEEHAVSISTLTHVLVRLVGDAAIVRIQCPILIGEHSEPQPDVAVVRKRSESYRTSHPRPEDILLLIEVADSSLAYDRERKVPLYARAGIPEVWLVDLDGDAVTAFSDPSPDGFRASRTVRRGEWLAPLSFPGREIAVSDILG